MPRIMADHDVEGQVEIFAGIWESAEWVELWRAINCSVETFKELGLPAATPDSDLWRFCQEKEIVLITGNRNEENESSLEATMKRENTVESLPVLTIADPKRVALDRECAERAAIRVFGLPARPRKEPRRHAAVCPLNSAAGWILPNSLPLTPLSRVLRLDLYKGARPA